MARTLADCLDELKRGKEITEAEFQRIRDAYEARRSQHRMALGDDAAASRAAAEIEADLTREALEKRRRAALTQTAQRNLKERLQEFRRGDDTPDINEAAMREVDRIGHRKNAIEAQARAMLADFLDATRVYPVTGVRRERAMIEDVIKAWHGDGNVPQNAKDFAGALDRTYEWLRQRENDAGGAVGKLENYGGPHWHDPVALRRAGYETWKAAALKTFDPERSGQVMAGRPFTPAEFEAALPRIFERITTEGWNERVPMMVRQDLGSLAGRHAEPRSLIAKDGAAWLDYNRDFGTGTPFEAIMRGVSNRARDIAAMEILGPNPDGMMTWLRQVVQKEGAEAAAGRPSLARKQGEKADRSADWVEHRLDAMWFNIKGEGNTPVSGTAAEVTGALRSINAAAKLGGAFLSSLGDLGTQKLARLFDGIGGSVLADITHYLARYRMSRDEAARAGLLVDSALTMFRDQAKYAKAWDVKGIAQSTRAGSDFLLDRVLANSALTPYTHAGRHVFGFSFFAEVADAAGQSFADMPPHLRATFERHGLTASDWNVIRTAPVHVPEASLKAGFIRPTDIMAMADGPALPRVQQLLKLDGQSEAAAAHATRRGLTEVATRYLEMVLAETEYAVPTGTVRARTLTLDKTRPGTVPGELVRASTQFRAYPMTFGLLWGQRIMDQWITDSVGGSWAVALGRGTVYATGLAVTVTLLGGLSVQLKNMRAGRDPESMDPGTPEGRKFWGAALAQGGGLGIFSDFVFADYNRYGNSLGATVLGPLGGDIEDLAKLITAPVKQVSDGKETKTGRQLVKMLYNHLPGGNIWYLDIAAQRLLRNNLQRMVDPDAEKAFARQIRNRQKERGQEFWWAPGDPPSQARLPDLGAALR